MRATSGNPTSSSIPVPPRALDAAALAEIAEAFHDRHRQTYGHDNRSEPVQIVSVRVTAIGAIPPLLIRDTHGAGRHRRGQGQAPGVVSRNRRGRRHRSTIARRMPAGLEAPGPAVIESLESTILVPPAGRRG